jgi:SAM-dependent methyltransferase
MTLAPQDGNLTLKQSIDEKYRLYSLSVQNPDHEVELLDKVYRRYNRRLPQSLREDFCGAFLNSVAWIQSRQTNHAIAVDIDPQPLGYGIRVNLPKLGPDEQKRLTIQSGNVLKVTTRPTDLICALNFSYYCFHDRKVLTDYFRRARQNLKPKGVFVIDCFGGPATIALHRDVIRFPKHGFKYFWQLLTYDYVNNRARYAIHFQKGRQPLLRNAFTYDWRMWSIPELREMMTEAGFKAVKVWLEGTTRKGEGNGVFEPTHASVEDCESWVGYISGQR